MNPFPQNNKGTILLYSVLLLFILSVLGTSLIGLTISNSKINKITGELGTAYYMADGAIEEFLAELKKVTHQAEFEASTWVNNGFKQTEEWYRFIFEIEEQLNNGDISNKEANEWIEEKLAQEFERTYFEYLIDHDKLKKVYTYINHESQEITVNLERVDFRPNLNEKKMTDNPINLVITSTYNQGEKKIEVFVTSDAEYNKYKKKIQLQLDVVLPEYKYILSSTVKRKKIYLNDIYGQVLTCEGNVVVSGGDVDVYGNIYAYGSFPNEIWPNSKDMGGVIAGSKEVDGTDITGILGELGNLTIHGDVMTRTSIQTSTDHSTIHIEGNAYCNSLLIGDTANNSIITVNNHVIMYDDIEINGNNGKIFIGGDLWGVFEGDPAGIYNDRSSSIIINADAGGEEVEISGGAYLGGTAYIRAYKLNSNPRQYYQTGESISLSKYAYIYQNLLPFEESYANFERYNDEENEYNFVIDHQSEKDKTDSTKFKVEHFLNYAYFYKEDLSKKIQAVDKEKVKIGGIDGNINTIDGNDAYAFGVVIANGYIYNPILFQNSLTYNMQRTVLLSDIDRKVNILKDRNYTDSRNNSSRFHDYVNNGVVVPNEISDFYHFVLINLDPTKDIYINPSMKVSDGNYVFQQDKMSGVIFTTGNVYITKDFEFNGTIIAQKNIIFYGNGTKQIRYDKNIIMKIIAQSDKLYNFFYGQTGKKTVISGRSDSNSLEVKIQDHTQYEEIPIYEIETLGSNKGKEMRTFIIHGWKEVI